MMIINNNYIRRLSLIVAILLLTFRQISCQTKLKRKDLEGIWKVKDIHVFVSSIPKEDIKEYTKLKNKCLGSIFKIYSNKIEKADNKCDDYELAYLTDSVVSIIPFNDSLAQYQLEVISEESLLRDKNQIMNNDSILRDSILWRYTAIKFPGSEIEESNYHYVGEALISLICKERKYKHIKVYKSTANKINYLIMILDDKYIGIYIDPMGGYNGLIVLEKVQK